MSLTLWIHATALCTFLQQGSAQTGTVPCFTGLGCASGSVGEQVSVLACCSLPDTISFRPNVGNESCFTCYDPFVVAFVDTMYTIDESMGSVSVCVNLTQPQIDILDETVNVFVMDNSSSVYIPADAPLATPDPPDLLSQYAMIEGSDYAQQTSAVNVIDDTLITELMRIVCYSQPIYDDLRLELDEFVGLRLGVKDNELTTVLTTVQPMYDQTSILIVDNDMAVVGLEQTFFRVEENVGLIQICVNVLFPGINCPIAFPFEVLLSTADGTAVQAMDYQPLDVTLMFEACETRRCVDAEIIDDTVEEPDEVFTYTLRRTPDLDPRIELNPVDGQVEIGDDDRAVVGLEQTFFRVEENVGLIQICVNVSFPEINCPIAFPFEVLLSTADGTAVQAMDYQPLDVTLTFQACETRICVDVEIIDDTVDEPDEVLPYSLTRTPDLDPRIELNPVDGQVEIGDDDNAVQTGFRTPGDGCITEGVLQEICLTTVGSPAVDTVLTVSVTYDTAGSEDFDLITSQVTITETKTEPCVSYQAIADRLGLEGVENLTLSLSGPPNVQLTTASLHICIQDSDVVTFEFFTGEAEGDESELEINANITRSVATAEEVSFTLTPTEYDASFGFPIPTFDPRSPNLATPGADYVPDVIQFTVPPGDGPTVIAVPIIDDVIAEDSNQYFIGVLGFSGNPTGAVLGRDAILLGIQDNDQATIRFQFLLSVVDEQDVDFTHNLLVTRDVDSEQNYSIALRGSPNTAEDDDFFVSDDTFYFPPDVSSINVSVTIRGDTRIELAETFDVRLRQRGGPNFVVDPLTRNIIVEIRDNDGDYIYVPAQSTYTVPEGEQREVSFVLDNPPPDGVFEFDYNVVLSTADGSATGGSDYMSIVDEVIAASTMPNGVVSMNVSVFSDDRVELEETFSVVGRVMESSQIAYGIGKEFPVVFQSPLDVSIINENVVSLRFADVAVTVTEGGSLLVCLEPVDTDVLDAEFTVQLSLLSGSATGGVDYVSEDLTVTIGPTGSGSPDTLVCINIDTATDTDIEGDESLTVIGTVTNNADLTEFPDGNMVSITIQDASVELGVEQIAYEVSEADGSLEKEMSTYWRMRW
ncbi:hypothetical protein GBAR_LOCUS28872 [Geodia barretti]|uniref:Calx-beta domain-containing protein n=1 Tax=Geodia barretti TaxID=519541 RepID=A0AA35TRD4_GEOBA|nr:hypothetical protein GBAR_LOCUS28872 [Geodia barretti]